MPLSDEEKIPNTPLDGKELEDYTMRLLTQEIDRRDLLSVSHREDVIEAARASFKNNYVFSPQYTYPNALINIELQLHVAGERLAFNLDITFKFMNLSSPTHKTFMRNPVRPPLLDIAPEVNQLVDGFKLSTTVDNPNLVRVHSGIPIKIQHRLPKQYGDLAAKFQTTEIKYDPHDYPELPPPTVVDTTEQLAKQWGVPIITWSHLPEDGLMLDKYLRYGCATSTGYLRYSQLPDPTVPVISFEDAGDGMKLYKSIQWGADGAVTVLDPPIRARSLDINWYERTVKPSSEVVIPAADDHLISELNVADAEEIGPSVVSQIADDLKPLMDIHNGEREVVAANLARAVADLEDHIEIKGDAGYYMNEKKMTAPTAVPILSRFTSKRDQKKAEKKAKEGRA